MSGRSSFHGTSLTENPFRGTLRVRVMDVKSGPWSTAGGYLDHRRTYASSRGGSRTLRIVSFSWGLRSRASTPSCRLLGQGSGRGLTSTVEPKAACVMAEEARKPLMRRAVVIGLKTARTSEHRAGSVASRRLSSSTNRLGSEKWTR